MKKKMYYVPLIVGATMMTAGYGPAERVAYQLHPLQSLDRTLLNLHSLFYHPLIPCRHDEHDVRAASSFRQRSSRDVH
ncbi:hypothetical protein ACN47E_004972 [Coniothyrium glycines]